MTLYVQTINGRMAQCIDTIPPSPIGTDGWKEAVEVRHAIVEHRQEYIQHVFNLETDPVQIVYGIVDISVDARKRDMSLAAGRTLQQMFMDAAKDAATYNPQLFEAARQMVIEQKAAIGEATTHDALDALM